MAQNDLSGIVTVTTTGTAVQGSDVRGTVFELKAHPDNTDTAWVGNVASDVSASNGFPMDPGETLVLQITNINQVWFDADVSGEKVCFIRMA